MVWNAPAIWRSVSCDESRRFFLKDARRVEDPSNDVVDELGFGERLVAALVGNDPQSSSKEPDSKSIQRPQGETRERIERGMGKRELLGSDERVCEGRCFVNGRNDNQVPDTIGDAAVRLVISADMPERAHI